MWSIGRMHEGEQAVKAQSVVEQALFVEDAGCVTLLE